MSVPVEQGRRVVGFELNVLRAAQVLGDVYEKASLAPQATPIYDVNGALLFYRFPLSRGRSAAGYADVAADEALGEPLLSTAMGSAWNEAALLRAGIAAAREQQRNLKYDTVRFVAYSFPKLALQFLVAGKEVLMLELYTWVRVPPLRQREPSQQELPSFERWSLLDSLPKETLSLRTDNFKQRLAIWDAPVLQHIDPHVIVKGLVWPHDFEITRRVSRELHYSSLDTDHHPCYELRGQQTPVWCVAASVEMVLDFYRYSYSQVRIAQELGLGTLAHPNGLPYGRDGDVVTGMEHLTSNALDVTMVANPDMAFFRGEIDANRPMISFVPGHSRSVAGYLEVIFRLGIWSGGFQGLLVYDPLPVNSGVITQWENFVTTTYRYAFASVLKQI
jgi:hypothetical protein